jgi:hypothetical protein
VVCHADGGVSQSFLKAMGPEIQKGAREKFQHVSQASLVQWVRLAVGSHTHTHTHISPWPADILLSAFSIVLRVDCAAATKRHLANNNTTGPSSRPVFMGTETHACEGVVLVSWCPFTYSLARTQAHTTRMRGVQALRNRTRHLC